MNGYVRNTTGTWRHATKRAIAPGQQLPLDELYEQYGKIHNLEEGDQFVEWLRSVKFQNPNIWEIVYKKEANKTTESYEASDTTVSKITEPENKKVDMITPFVSVKRGVKDVIGLDDVVNMSVRTAKAELSKIMDLNLLRNAYGIANKMAKKDNLCILIRRRIKELEASGARR